MEPDPLTRQARSAVDSLTEQLRSLETQQTALLHSLSLTHSTLHTLPSYTTIAPTFSKIPHYESKLARLKHTMAVQQREVAELRRRAQEAGVKRRGHLERIEEGRRGEREMDRTVLRARFAGGGGGGSDGGGDAGGRNEGVEEVVVTGGGAEGGGQTAAAAAVVKTVKRRRKVRVAEMQE